MRSSVPSGHSDGREARRTVGHIASEAPPIPDEAWDTGEEEVMGYIRIRRSVKIAPGMRINLSKSGPSVSAGPRGAKVTIGPGGRRVTVGVPGTGASYTAIEHPERPAHPEPEPGLATDQVLSASVLGSLTPAQERRAIEARARDLERVRRAAEKERRAAAASEGKRGHWWNR